MKTILSFIVYLFLTLSTMAQTTWSPPTQVPQPDGTIQLVPVPPAIVYTPYFIDPTMQYQVYLTSQWTNKSWNGGTKNGLTAFKNQVITVDILAMPYAKTKVVDGKTVYLWSIYRSTDAVIQYDHTRLELLPVETTPESQGNGFDSAVMDATKSKYTLLSDGLFVFHSEALKVPEVRTKAQYYQWNFDGYMWQAAYRKLGQIKFKVKDDYYLPTKGYQKSFVRLLPFTIHQGNTIYTKVDGSPTIGTNVFKDIHTECEGVVFGAPPDYKVAHYLTAPVTQFKVGDIVPVKIMIKPETKPQWISSVATNFIWDNNIVEFVGLDKTGALASMDNSLPQVGPTNINEALVPKDGNASHVWLSPLTNKNYLDKEALIVTLKFKVLVNFNTTTIQIAKQNDARLVGLWVPEESRPIGSNIPGVGVLGTQTPSVTINGIIP